MNCGRSARKRILSVLALSLALVLALVGCGKKQTSNNPPDPFRDKLAADGQQVIELTGETVLAGTAYVVEGNKTLTGSGTITAGELTEDFMLTVADGATLTLDGITITGGGEHKSGILVSEGGTLVMESGEISGLTRLGLRVEGEATVKGVISDTGTSWAEVREGGSLNVAGAMFSQSGGVGIQTYKGAKLSVTDGTVLTGSRSNIVFNNGEAYLDGVDISDAAMYLVSNNGTMTVVNSTVSKAGSQGLMFNYEGADLLIKDSTLTDSADYILSNSGKATFEGVQLSASKGYTVYNVGEGADFTARDTTVKDTGATAFFNRVGSTMTLANITTENVGGHNILNRGGSVTATGFKAAGGGAVVFMNQSATDKDLTYGTMTVENFEVASAPGYGIMSYGGAMTLKNGTVGKCGSSGVYIRDGKGTLVSVRVLGVNGKDPLPGIQVGHTDTHNTVVTMTDVDVSGAYRGINNRGHLTFHSGTISGNRNAGVYKSGGGINNYGTLILNGGTISGNTSLEGGGGIFNQGKLTVNGGTITGNKAGTSGGGISNSKNGTVTINRGDIVNNASTTNGGGIYNGGTLNLLGGTVKGNTNGREGTGGGVVNAGVLNMRGGTITANASSTSAGGLQNTSTGVAVLSGGRISANTTANGKGGAGIYNTGKLTLQGSVQVTDNKSAGGGAAINNAKSTSGSVGEVTITGGTFSGNVAGTSGGVIANSAKLTLTGGTLSSNKAANNGGAVYNTGELMLGGAAFKGNTAGKNGPDLFNDGGKVTLTGTVKADLWTNAVLSYNDAFSASSAINLSRFGDLKGRKDVARAAVGAKSRDVSGAFITADGSKVTTDGVVNTAVEARLLDSNGKQKATGTLVDMMAKAATGDVVELIADVTVDSRITLSGKPVILRDDGKARTVTVTAPNRAFQLNKGAGLYVEGRGGLTFKGSTSASSAIVVNESSILDMSGRITVTGFNGTCETDKSGGAFIWNTTTGTTVLDGVTFKNNKSAKNGAVLFSGGGKVTLANVTTSGNSAGSGQDFYLTGETQVAIYNGTYTSGTSYGGKASVFVNENCALTLGGRINGDLTAYKLTAKLADFDPKSKITLYLDGYSSGKVVLTGDANVIRTAVEAGAFDLPRAATQSTPKALRPDGTIGAAGTGGAPAVSTGEKQAKLLGSDGSYKATGSLAAMLGQAQSGDVVEIIDDITIASRITVQEKHVTLRDDGRAHTVTVTSANRAFQLNKSAKLTVTGTQSGGLTFKGSPSGSSAICVNEDSTLTMTGRITVTGFDGSCLTDKSGGAFIWNTTTGTTVLDGVTFTGNQSAKNGGVMFSGGGSVTLKNVTTSANSAGSGQDFYLTGETEVVIDGGSFKSGTAHGGNASVFVNENCTLTLKGKPTVDLTAYKLVTDLDNSFSNQARVTLYLDGYAGGKVVLRGSEEVLQAVVQYGSVVLPRALEQTSPKVVSNEGVLVNADGSTVITPAKPGNDPVARLLAANGTEKASGTFADMMAKAEDGDILELFADVTVHERYTVTGKHITIRDDGKARTMKITSTSRGFQLNNGAGLTVEGRGGLTVVGASSGSVGIYVNTGSTLKVSGAVTVTGFKCTNTSDTAGGAFVWNSSNATTVLDGVTAKDNKSAASGSVVYAAGGTVKLINVTASGNASASGQDVHVTGSTQLTIDGGSFTSGTGKGSRASVYVNEYASVTLKGKPALDLTALCGSVELDEGLSNEAKVTLYLNNYAAGRTVLTGPAGVVSRAVEAGAFTLPAADKTTLQADGKLK
ncbi:MAG: hypothetical protein IJP02_06630 [Oscillospiraceae bacterium]|nr:hypothetical protein [Oscillospiraceae bacterium]